MEKSNIYYLPINSANISQYFKRGIILPAINIDGWINDSQSKYTNMILLCSKSLVKELDSSLTIVFSSDELKEIKQISENFYIFNKPLPISRIKNINFLDKEQSEITIYNIEKGDAFIPKQLIKIINTNESRVDINEINTINNTHEEQDWKEKIGLYNKLLGGFSVMRIADFQNTEYPKNYFNCFAFINKHIRSILSEFKFEKNYQTTIDILEKKLPSIYHKITIEEAKNYAKKYDNIELPIKRGLIRLNEINEDKNSYILSILATYGEDSGKTKKISDFIAALINNTFSSKKTEQLCLIFGINQGYSAFRNKYKINDYILDTKFKLNSELDYTIIESIYQYVFNSVKENTTFSYINSWCTINKEMLNLKEYDTYEILDKEIVYKKKAPLGSEEYLQELYQLFTINNILKSLFEVTNEKVSNAFKEIINKIYTKIKNDIKRNEESNKKDMAISTEKTIGLKDDNNQLSIQQKELLSPVSNDTSNSVSNLENNNSKVSDNILKDVAKEIKSIGDLQVIAKHIGVEANIYKKYKKTNIEELREVILTHQRLI